MLTKVCLVCGKEFAKLINESLKNWKNRHKFCSRSCLCKYFIKEKNLGMKTRFKRGQRAINPIKRGQRLSVKTEFKKGQIPWNKDRFWTKEERQKIADGLPIRMGKNSANWRGGTTKLRTSIMSLNKYKQWRTSVFKRDNYTCQKCGTKGKIQCHHKKPIQKIIKENNIKTTGQAKKCKALWRMSNGQTLCIPCHRQTDSYLVVSSKKDP